MSRSLSNKKSSREKVPSSRFDLSMTGTCGAIPCSLTSQSDRNFTCWANVNVAFLVEQEVVSREGAILTLRLVDDRDMRRDPLLVDEPIRSEFYLLGKCKCRVPCRTRSRLARRCHPHASTCR